MTEIQVNLKRFDVPFSHGGICPDEKPADWIRNVVRELNNRNLEKYGELGVTMFPPEGILLPALEENRISSKNIVSIGSQGIHFQDIVDGGNFGAYSTSFPAAASHSYGCRKTMIGHSEERKKFADIIAAYDSREGTHKAAASAINRLLAEAVSCAAKRKLQVTFCVGETAGERGEGDETTILNNVTSVLREQILSLKGIINPNNLILAYEPRWAIGPGKVPPDAEEIGRIAASLKDICREVFNTKLPVLYGGGLKVENAENIGSQKAIDGGLIALTKFTGKVAFDPCEMEKIVELFMRQRN